MIAKTCSKVALMQITMLFFIAGCDSRGYRPPAPSYVDQKTGGLLVANNGNFICVIHGRGSVYADIYINGAKAGRITAGLVLSQRSTFYAPTPVGEYSVELRWEAYNARFDEPRRTFSFVGKPNTINIVHVDLSLNTIGYRPVTESDPTEVERILDTYR